ncbi:hypothetical protein ACFYXH_04755 [Streptomyces sp. NPDC002730]|uniref:hypothetical protein n=1 Tax=Streptomyces sp. NPDC002730 TaxID=3364662 RepID=UPI00369016A5
MRSRKIAIATAGLMAVLVSGCGTSSAKSAMPTLHASRVKDYKTFAELKQDSTAVVKVTASGSVKDGLNKIPTTVTTVNVDSVLWGKVPAKSLAIQQLGRSNMKLDDTGALLVAGRQYLLFVQPFHLTRGDNTSLYQITGGQGVYQLDKKNSEYSFTGGGAPKLPKEFAAEEAVNRTR